MPTRRPIYITADTATSNQLDDLTTRKPNGMLCLMTDSEIATEDAAQLAHWLAEQPEQTRALVMLGVDSATAVFDGTASAWSPEQRKNQGHHDPI